MRKYTLTILPVLLFALTCCNTAKFVPEGHYLLNKTKIEITDTKAVDASELKTYLRQVPNTEILGFWKLQLHIYNTAPSDTTTKSNKRLARNAHKIGEAPEIYDPVLTETSMNQLQKAMKNKGYFNATVDTFIRVKDRKLTITYSVTANQPYTLRNYSSILPQNDLKRYATSDLNSKLQEGMLFNTSEMDAERQRISSEMRRNGYFYFDKEMLRYEADSTWGSHQVDAVLSLQPYITQLPDSQQETIFRQYYIRRVYFHLDYDPDYAPKDEILHTDSIDDYFFTWVGTRLLRPQTLRKNCLIRPRQLYNESLVERSYENLNSLGIIKYVDISFEPVGINELDCHVVLSRNKLNTFTTEAEGTYSAGDWGVMAGVGYINKNIFHGAEELSLNVKGGYEWRQNGSRAIEAKATAGLRFPNTLKIGLEYNYQTRPSEFTRTIANANLSYSIHKSNSRWRHDFKFVDISYVYLPWIDSTFRATFLQPTNILKYSYEDHFITAFSYSFGYSSYRERQPYRPYGSVHFQVETAGNVLYGIAAAAKTPKNQDGAYTLFNIPFAQYVKSDFDFVYHGIINEHHRIVLHGAVGVAVPYGNALSIPFEKRYFSGGSNSVRGWTARTLGPGCYRSKGDLIDYNNQAGDIRLDLNAEYRWKVWKFIELAAFADAGNIWTIRDYETQPHGVFRWNEFYKQLALSYGAGLRLDLNFLVLRLDFAFKLHDPSRQYEDGKVWRTASNGLNWKDDAAVHFAIGYPF